MTTADYLNQLTQDRDDLVTNLEAKGISGLTGNETFTELVPEVLNIPSGGGTTIHGTPISSIVQSGNISKGDFVKRGDFTINDKLSSATNYRLFASSTIENEQNLFDDDENTYATIAFSTGAPRIYVQCKSREQLGIPSDARLMRVDYNFKISWRYTGSQYPKYYAPIKYTNGNINSVVGAGSGINCSGETFPLVVSSRFDDDYVISTSDTNCYGAQFYSSGSYNDNRIYLYYVSFDIYYEYESQIKKVTDSGQVILGIANQDGTQGDTIQVLIPDVE